MFHGYHQLENPNQHHLSMSFTTMITLGNMVAILSNDNINTNRKEEIASIIKNFIHCSDQEFLSLMGEIYDLKYEADRLI